MECWWIVELLESYWISGCWFQRKASMKGTLPVFPSSYLPVTISWISHHIGKIQSTMFAIWRGFEMEEFIAENERGSYVILLGNSFTYQKRMLWLQQNISIKFHSITLNFVQDDLIKKYIYIYKEYFFTPFIQENFISAIIAIIADGNIATVFKICVVLPGVLQIRLVPDMSKKKW